MDCVTVAHKKNQASYPNKKGKKIRQIKKKQMFLQFKFAKKTEKVDRKN
jgi:hypothetical protein